MSVRVVRLAGATMHLLLSVCAFVQDPMKLDIRRQHCTSLSFKVSGKRTRALQSKKKVEQKSVKNGANFIYDVIEPII
jgi:hypothetical protein